MSTKSRQQKRENAYNEKDSKLRTRVLNLLGNSKNAKIIEEVISLRVARDEFRKYENNLFEVEGCDLKGRDEFRQRNKEILAMEENVEALFRTEEHVFIQWIKNMWA